MKRDAADDQRCACFDFFFYLKQPDNRRCQTGMDHFLFWVELQFFRSNTRYTGYKVLQIYPVDTWKRIELDPL